MEEKKGLINKPVLVTALYDLDKFEASHNLQNTLPEKRRPFNWYLENCRFTLSQPVPLIVFTESRHVPVLEKIRCQYTTAPTHWITNEIEELAYFKDLDFRSKVLKNSQTYPFITDNPSKTTPSYFMLMWNKIEFIAKAKELFPDFTVYVWIDAGIGPFATRYIPAEEIDLKHVATFLLSSEHFGCTIINPVTVHEFANLDAYYGSWQYRLCGNFWSVGRHIIDFFINNVRRYLQEMINTEHVAPDEELLARFTYEFPHMCKFSFGDYYSSIVNRNSIIYDRDVANRAIDKAHVNALHTMASQGFELLLGEGCNHSVAQILDYMVKWFIETFYVDQLKARWIYQQIVSFGQMHVYIARELITRKSYYDSIFRFVYDQPDTFEITYELDKLILNLSHQITSNSAQYLRIQDIPNPNTFYSKTLHDQFQHFVNLQLIMASNDENFTGSYMIHHDHRYEPNLFLKQKQLFDLIVDQQIENVVEIGVNAGHSLLIMLLANPSIKVEAFDLCEFNYTEPCVQYLTEKFPLSKIHLKKGCSPLVYQQNLHFVKNQRCEHCYQTNGHCYSSPQSSLEHKSERRWLFHIDGCHEWHVMLQELYLTLTICKPGDIIIMDDTDVVPHFFEHYGHLRPLSNWKRETGNTKLVSYPNSAYECISRPIVVDESYQVRDASPCISTITTRTNIQSDPLTTLAEQHGSDKCWKIKHHYTFFYDMLMQNHRTNPVRLMEIGIGSPLLMGQHYKPGASLRMWRDYFPSGEIIGLDIDASLLINEERIASFQVDQSNPTSLLSCMKDHKLEEIDFIVDDGSHILEHQITSLNTLLKFVKPGGLYIIEDVKLANFATDQRIDHEYIHRIEEFHMSPTISDDRLVIIWRNLRRRSETK